MDCIKIRDNIYWVGVLDPEMRIFDIVLLIMELLIILILLRIRKLH